MVVIVSDSRFPGRWQLLFRNRLEHLSRFRIFAARRGVSNNGDNP
jgi:hypothetical protein